MGLSRRFLNVIMDKRIAGFQTLRCIDLERNKLFNTKPPNGVRRQSFKTEKMFPLPTPTPRPCFSMRASSGHMHCCPAPADRRVLCLDQSGRSLLLEADTSRIVMMPCLQPKLDPISFYIPDSAEPEPEPQPQPDPEADLDDLLKVASGGGTFFIMDRIAKLEEAASCQFEALVYRNPNYKFLPSKSWNCDPLPPPPPYLHRDDNTRHSSCLEISSYTVIKDDKGGCHICISIDGVGTYCFDTVSYKWSQVGKWTLPLQGKVEYVPELNLWFGFSANDGHFAAADLSTMKDSQPQLLDSWQELEPPQGWQQTQDPQLVNLGSGRFCITRFFLHTRTGAGTGTPNTIGSGDESICYQNNFTALSGVEVVAHGFKDQVNLEIVKHKTRCHKASCGDDTIVAVL